MGVRGLSTFLKEHQRILSKAHSFPFGTVRTNVVVDGWSFIYDIHHRSGLSWVYGGEYSEFAALVHVVVNTWIAAGFNIHFVFDGPYHEIKFPTLISRMTESHIQPSLLFFRTSTEARKRSLQESRILPPASYPAALSALNQIAAESEYLEIYHADEEGDPYAVELAGRIGAYVIGHDSDFVVLNSEGYKGYIPLDEMVWTAPALPEEPAPAQDNEDEWDTVKKPKTKKARAANELRAGRGIIPPEGADLAELKLSFTSYEPTTLAAHVGLPVTLLPLLGAIVGNDFTNQAATGPSQRTAQSLFFDGRLSMSQRITRVSTTLQTILSASAQRKRGQQVNSVMGLIEKTVNTLLVKSISTMGSGEVEGIVDRIVEATLQYSIPKYTGEVPGEKGLWTTPICPLHEVSECPLMPLVSRVAGEGDEDKSEGGQARRKYIEAYRKGRLNAKVLDTLCTGTYWPRLFLEDPDLETVGRSIGRPIRVWGYALLDEAVGLPEPVEVREESEGGDDEEEVDEEDELVDVVEEHSEEDEDDSFFESEDGEDPLAPLQSALEKLRLPDQISTPRVARTTRPKTITEYVRRGTRAAPEEVAVPPMEELFSSLSGSPPENPGLIQLQPLEDRFTLFLRILESDVPSVKSLAAEHLMAVLAVRWVIHILYTRASSGGGKEKDKERWTKGEARALLASFSSNPTPLPEGPPPAIIDRNVQLTAQILMALESIEHLAQILLITDRCPAPAHLVSGKRFHAYLTGTPAGVLSAGLWDATAEGLDSAFAEERRKKAGKKAAPAPAKPVVKGRGAFALLDVA